MTPQERDLILAVAQRLRQTPLREKDNEADRLIQAEIGSQRDALYLLTQAVIVQEQALKHAQERLGQLESQGSRPAGGSFLGGTSGAAGEPAPPPPPPPAPAAGGSGVGSFLRTAAAAAAGAVGGQLIYDGLRNVLGGSGYGGMAGGSFLGGGSPVIDETVINENVTNVDDVGGSSGGDWAEDDPDDQEDQEDDPDDQEEDLDDVDDLDDDSGDTDDGSW